MALWVEAGQPAERFWHLTPREIDAILRGAGARMRHDQNARAWLAWHVAALGRVKKLPKIDALMLKPPRPKDQPSEKDAAMVRGYLIALSMRSNPSATPRRTNGRGTEPNSPAAPE